ncbi:MAG: hypothetical protein JXR95_03535 [Deltaproteobacteria bacterium]|nr:hypothetical protein [Deltaproteobacteria bacterium]
MNRRIIFILVSLLGLTFFTDSKARRRRVQRRKGVSNVEHRKMLLKDPIINKYLKTNGGTTSAGWKDESFRNTVKLCGANWHCTESLNMMIGKKNSALTEYYKDGLATQVWGGISEFKMTFIDENHYLNAAFGALFHQVPNAADLIAPVINTTEKIYNLWGHVAHTPYWVLFYLGAKNKIKDMLPGLEEARATVSHVKAMYQFTPAWKLSSATKASMENICINKAFQGGKYESVAPYCLRWMGLTNSKNKTAKRFLKRYFTSNRGYEQLEAIHAIAHLNDKSMKKLLQENLAKSYFQKKENVKVGRRYKKKLVDTWGRNFNSIPTALTLLGMDDSKAKKAINYWLKFDDKKKRCDHTAIEMLFMETAVSSVSIQKKMKKDLQNIYKKLVKYQSRNSQFKNVVRYASLALIQMGDTTGMKGVMDILGSGNINDIKELLAGLGGDPEKWVGSPRNRQGLGYLKVGKNGISVKNAKKIARKIKSELPVWGDKFVKGLALRAYIDINARIHIAEKKL